MFSDCRKNYAYTWPSEGSLSAADWQVLPEAPFRLRLMPESTTAIERDSRWPAFFPAPICIVSATIDGITHLERVVGPSIVNRFPYVMALSLCIQPLSERHYRRSNFIKALEAADGVAVHFFEPGAALDSVLSAIAAHPDEESHLRLKNSGLRTRRASSNSAEVLHDAYLVYEGRLKKPAADFSGNPIYQEPWSDIGSHRLYYFEIEAIALEEQIARGKTPIHWRSLPSWQQPGEPTITPDSAALSQRAQKYSSYVKSFEPNYVFPSSGTIAFAWDELREGFAIRHLPPLPEDQVEVDNDAARWPAFFPSSLGLITTQSADGAVNCIPCGSTTVVSRHPMVIAPCISYSKINERYAPRASLDLLQNSKRFVCSIPFADDGLISAISYLGSVSFARDRDKVSASGLSLDYLSGAAIPRQLPIHYDCEIIGEERLGTHFIFFGEVKKIYVRNDVTAGTPLEWCPYATIDISP